MAGFRLFGPLAATVAGDEVDLGPPKQRSLLAVLLLSANQFVSVDTLTERIWGDRAPRTSHHSIQLYVSSLRRALGDDAPIETLPGGYRIVVDPSTIDIERFEAKVARALGLQRAGQTEEATTALRVALDAWSGPPLAGFEYDEFAQPIIARLNELHTVAQEEAAEADLDSGRHQEALLRANDLVTLHPLRERPRTIQMRSLYHLGRQPEALRAYRAHVDLLGSELGVGPSSAMQHLEELILLQDPSLTATEPAAIRNPYKGLMAFQESDAADFFGRDRLAAGILTRLEEHPSVLSVVGPSGAGKSSVVLAGVVPKLRAQEGRPPKLVVISPGPRPLAALRAALATATGTKGLDEPPEILIRRAVEAFGWVILIVDQLEELFTQAPESDADRFLDALAEASAVLPGALTILLTLRADYYGHPLLHPGFAQLFSGSVIDVPPLDPPEVEAAICGPASRAGLPAEPTLVALLVSDMARDPGALAHLQYALTEMAEPDRGLTVEEYERLGRMEGLIGRTADKLLDGLDPDAREAIKQVFLRLVSVDGTGVSRRSAPMRELLDTAPDVETGHALMSRLIGSRLVTADRDPATGSAQVIVTHEALLTGWDQLSQWIEGHREEIRLHGRLREAAREWSTNPGDRGFLLTGARLARYTRWEEGAGLRLTPEEVQFLEASIRDEEEAAITEAEHAEDLVRMGARARRRMWGLAAAIIVAVAAVTYSVLALRPEPPPRIAVLTEELQGDFTEAVNRAAEAVPDAVAIPVSGDTIAATIADLANRGTELIITLSQWESETIEAAEDHPTVTFAVLDRGPLPPPPDLPNLSFVGLREEEGSFLAGVAAALASETQHIGFIGGVELPVVFAFQAGFEQGARLVNPAIEIEKIYLSVMPDFSGFNSPTLAAAVTTEMLEDGVDVVYPAAGDSAQGSLEAARRHLALTGRHVWVIGVDVDRWSEIERAVGELTGSDVDEGFIAKLAGWRSHILTSMTKDMGTALRAVVDRAAEGTFEPGAISLGLVDHAVGLSTTGGAIDEYLPYLSEIEERIISGALIVSRTPEWDYERVFPLLPDEAAYWDAVWQSGFDG